MIVRPVAPERHPGTGFGSGDPSSRLEKCTLATGGFMALTREGDVQGDVCSGGEVPWGSEGDVQGDVRSAWFAPMDGLAPSAVDSAHEGISGGGVNHESAKSNRARSRVLAGPVRWAVGAAALAVAAAALAGCSSGPAHKASTISTTPVSTVSLPPGSSAAQATVLTAWEDAEQTLYSYLLQPWQQDRADLVAGETSADLWPKLADYFTSQALQSEDEFLVGVKMAQLNGPTMYNLGHPAVAAINAATATVTSCLYDTGTTTASGQPAASNLGGGAGSYDGTWDVQLISGTWKIASFQTTTVSKC